MKQRFITILQSVDRNGILELIDYLENHTDFFTAPASSQHHGAHEGGLVEHSLAVYDNLIRLMDLYFDDYDQESCIVCGLLHDLCKANFYKVEYRNRKNESGQWEKYPYYAIDDQLPLGHGEKSVILLQHFIRMDPGEIAAIRWHMGGFDDAGRSYGGGQALSAAMNKWHMVTALHMADLAACYFEGR